MTLEIKSKFNNLHIKGIRESNCDDIERSLSVAMKKAHAPEKLHLQFAVSRSNAFNLVKFNAEHLVSLDLWKGVIEFRKGISENVVWPQFPKLRELKIECSLSALCLPILMNSRETLEYLSIHNYYDDDDSDYARVVMPRLTDLHLIEVNDVFMSKMCSYNHRSLEFIQ